MELPFLLLVLLTLALAIYNFDAIANWLGDRHLDAGRLSHDLRTRRALAELEAIDRATWQRLVNRDDGRLP